MKKEHYNIGLIHIFSVLLFSFLLFVSGCGVNDVKEDNTKQSDEINWDVEDEEADKLETIELTIESIQKAANTERQKNVISRNEMFFDSETAEEDANAISAEEAQLIKKADSPATVSIHTDTLSKEDAIEDMELLADIIRSSYGSYYLYDKEEWKNGLSKSVEEIKKFENDLIDVYSLRKIILDSYSFIKDDHFRVDGKSVMESTDSYLYYCYIPDLYFYKDSRGYFTYKNDKKWYLTSVGDDNNVDGYIKPTITEEGQLAYQIGTFLGMFDDKRTSFNLSRGDTTNSVKSGFIVSQSLKEKMPILKTQAGLYDGYYVLAIRSFSLSVDENGHIALDPELYRYSEMAEKLQGTSNFIIDSRSNDGGGDVYFTDWYESYTNTQFKLTMTETRRYSRITGNNRNFLGTEINKIDGSYAENKNLFVYLMDKDVGSAGERGILAMKQMENVLLIGTNSKGCIIGGFYPYILPNSKITVSVGDAASFEGNSSKETEGLGLMPDIYVDGYLALDRAIKMYQYYGLLPDENVTQLETWGSEIPRFE